MAFNDLQMKAASEAAIIVMKEHMAKLAPFAHSYDELDGRPGETIAIPVYDLSASAEFNADSNNYCSGTETPDGILLNLDKHLVKSAVITDRQLESTGINWTKDIATAEAEVLAKDVNKNVFGLFTNVNVALSGEIDTTTKTTAAQLFALAQENGIDPYDSVLVLDPGNFSNVLAMLDTSVYGGTEAIRYGIIPNLFGFKAVICTSYLPDGVNGVIVRKDAVGIVSRYLQPMAGAYPSAWKATTEDGVAIGFREFTNLCTGRRYMAAEVLFGFKLLQPTQAIRLINKA